jgi:hypothetical protein
MLSIKSPVVSIEFAQWAFWASLGVSQLVRKVTSPQAWVGETRVGAALEPAKCVVLSLCDGCRASDVFLTLPTNSPALTTKPHSIYICRHLAACVDPRRQ